MTAKLIMPRTEEVKIMNWRNSLTHMRENAIMKAMAVCADLKISNKKEQASGAFFPGSLGMLSGLGAQ